MDARPSDSVALVAGASGYVGGRLVPALLERGFAVRCLARRPEKLSGHRWRSEVEVVAGDVAEPAGLDAAFEGVDVAYYLVHSLGSGPDWRHHDRIAARNFRVAAEKAGVTQIVYLGGLGDASTDLSAHLESRQEVGRELAAGSVPVTELRAAVIIGSGSASFEMLRHLVEVLPVMVTPKWVDTRCQPIAIRDVLRYLVGVALDERALGRVFEIGGADVVTYRQMMEIYAAEAGLARRVIFPVPVLSPRLSSLWIGLVTPLPVPLARTLVDSLVNEVVVSDNAIDEIVPGRVLSTREAIAVAIRRVADLRSVTNWAGAELGGRSPADPLPTDPDWSGGTMLVDERHVVADAGVESVYRTVAGIGGDRGWLVATGLWRIRGLLDLAIGGIGLRRGRRHPDELRVGDALDFWRVEALEPDRLIRLRAEMKLPGDAWLEWRFESLSANRTRIVQLARFHPRGLLGRAYWYALWPFHAFVFGPLLRRLGEIAEQDVRRRGRSEFRR